MANSKFLIPLISLSLFGACENKKNHPQKIFYNSANLIYHNYSYKLGDDYMVSYIKSGDLYKYKYYNVSSKSSFDQGDSLEFTLNNSIQCKYSSTNGFLENTPMSPQECEEEFNDFNLNYKNYFRNY